MSIELTEISINKMENKGKLLAFAKITINDCFVVNGVRLINGEKGWFVAMPSIVDKQGTYRDVCFPINKETRTLITEAVIKEYKSSGDESDDPFN